MGWEKEMYRRVVLGFAATRSSVLTSTRASRKYPRPSDRRGQGEVCFECNGDLKTHDASSMPVETVSVMFQKSLIPVFSHGMGEGDSLMRWCVARHDTCLQCVSAFRWTKLRSQPGGTAPWRPGDALPIRQCWHQWTVRWGGLAPQSGSGRPPIANGAASQLSGGNHKNRLHPAGPGVGAIGRHQCRGGLSFRPCLSTRFRDWVPLTL